MDTWSISKFPFFFSPSKYLIHSHKYGGAPIAGTERNFLAPGLFIGGMVIICRKCWGVTSPDSKIFGTSNS